MDYLFDHPLFDNSYSKRKVSSGALNGAFKRVFAESAPSRFNPILLSINFETLLRAYLKVKLG